MAVLSLLPAGSPPDWVVAVAVVGLQALGYPQRISTLQISHLGRSRYKVSCLWIVMMEVV